MFQIQWLEQVPVTVNWQADTPERVVYKLSATKTKLMLTDSGVPAGTLALAQVRSECENCYCKSLLCIHRVFLLEVQAEMPALVVGEAETLIQGGTAIDDEEMCSDLSAR